jgi:hypothetical protein
MDLSTWTGVTYMYSMSALEDSKYTLLYTSGLCIYNSTYVCGCAHKLLETPPRHSLDLMRVTLFLQTTTTRWKISLRSRSAATHVSKFIMSSRRLMNDELIAHEDRSRLEIWSSDDQRLEIELAELEACLTQALMFLARQLRT